MVTDGGIEKKRIIESRLTLDRGFFGNLKTFGTMGFGRTPKDELKDIKKITDNLAYKLGCWSAALTVGYLILL